MLKRSPNLLYLPLNLTSSITLCLCERLKKFHLSSTFIQNFKVLYWTSMAVYWFTCYNFRLITKVSQKRKKRRDQKEEKNLENLKRNLFEFLTPKLLKTHHFKFLTKLTNLMNLVPNWDVKVLKIVRYTFTNFATKKVRFYLLYSAIINSVWNKVLLSVNHRCGRFFFRGGSN